MSHAQLFDRETLRVRDSEKLEKSQKKMITDVLNLFYSTWWGASAQNIILSLKFSDGLNSTQNQTSVR